jgi:hypothetical protein
MRLPRSLVRHGFRALDRLVEPAVRRGLANPLPLGFGAVVLETTGHETGELRRVPLLSLRIGDAVVVSTRRSSSQWMQNLREHPEASVTLFGRERAATSELVDLPALQVAVLHLAEGA